MTLRPHGHQMCRHLGYEEVPAGTYLWRKGELADRMCVVISGEASVWTHPEGASTAGETMAHITYITVCLHPAFSCTMILHV
jgi:hypothetical protein